MTAHFEIVETDGGENGQPWHVRLLASNGRIVMASETYTRRVYAEIAVAVAPEVFGVRMSRPPVRDVIDGQQLDRLVGARDGLDWSFDVRYVDERGQS